MSGQVRWLSTKDASARLGVTLRSLYRFIDGGELAAYKFGRVIRLKEEDVERYIEECRIAPGDLEHLLPARRTVPDATDRPAAGDDAPSVPGQGGWAPAVRASTDRQGAGRVTPRRAVASAASRAGE
ncbi:MAG: helix-turn-helix domain-containing protein [Acidimicrobiales bacterium]